MLATTATASLHLLSIKESFATETKGEEEIGRDKL